MKPIILKNISLYFPNRICFEDFSAQIQSGDRIAVIGNNGSGKSTLLKIISGQYQPSKGEVQNNRDVRFGYVPQIILEYKNLSGGEKFNKALSAVLARRPDVLLLDKPTNHLDLKNRGSLMKMLKHYKGTVITVSHDIELLRSSINTFWHIGNGSVKTFSGMFDNYKNDLFQKRKSLKEELSSLKKDKREAHRSLMKEQQRAAKSKRRGEKLVEQKRWIPAVKDAKQNTASRTADGRSGALGDKRALINDRMQALRIPEILKPKFSLAAKDIGLRTIISVSGGGVAYGDKIIIENISFQVAAGEHLAITGNNGSGKTTVFKAVLNDPEVLKTGVWDTPAVEDIGCLDFYTKRAAYFFDTPAVEDIGCLDQYYGDLNPAKTVLDTISDIMPDKTHEQVRAFLNDFLFRKNEDINKRVSVLSGGEKARLSLAKISAKTPKLLLLDEITNNIDLETKEHLT